MDSFYRRMSSMSEKVSSPSKVDAAEKEKDFRSLKITKEFFSDGAIHKTEDKKSATNVSPWLTKKRRKYRPKLQKNDLNYYEDLLKCKTDPTLLEEEKEFRIKHEGINQPTMLSEAGLPNEKTERKNLDKSKPKIKVLLGNLCQLALEKASDSEEINCLTYNLCVEADKLTPEGNLEFFKSVKYLRKVLNMLLEGVPEVKSKCENKNEHLSSSTIHPTIEDRTTDGITNKNISHDKTQSMNANIKEALRSANAETPKESTFPSFESQNVSVDEFLPNPLNEMLQYFVKSYTNDVRENENDKSSANQRTEHSKNHENFFEESSARFFTVEPPEHHKVESTPTFKPTNAPVSPHLSDITNISNCLITNQLQDNKLFSQGKNYPVKEHSRRVNYLPNTSKRETNSNILTKIEDTLEKSGDWFNKITDWFSGFFANKSTNVNSGVEENLLGFHVNEILSEFMRSTNFEQLCESGMKVSNSDSLGQDTWKEYENILTKFILDRMDKQNNNECSSSDSNESSGRPRQETRRKIKPNYKSDHYQPKLNKYRDNSSSSSSDVSLKIWQIHDTKDDSSITASSTSSIHDRFRH